jgi:hypothetical protein
MLELGIDSVFGDVFTDLDGELSGRSKDEGADRADNSSFGWSPNPSAFGTSLSQGRTQKLKNR